MDYRKHLESIKKILVNFLGLARSVRNLGNLLLIEYIA